MTKRCSIDRRAYLAGTLLSALILLFGCDAYEPGVETSWTIGDCEILQEVKQSTNTWPDPTFLRTYWCTRNGHKLLIGSHENESSTGDSPGPIEIDGSILIPTSNRVYRLGPNEQGREFYPGKAKRWDDFLESQRAYDYRFSSARESDGVWRLTYVAQNGLDDEPQPIHFLSRDGWNSFKIEPKD